MGRGFLRHGIELVRRLMLDGEWWASPRVCIFIFFFSIENFFSFLIHNYKFFK